MKLLIFCLCLFPAFALAQLSNESEIGYTSTNGNTKTLSLIAKQVNDYKWDSNVLGLRARYLNGRANGTENARYFLTGLRYEREISSQFSLFSGETFEKDKFADIDKRWASDVGGKYKIIHLEKTKLFTELGYRYRHETRLSGGTSIGQYIRNYNEWETAWTPGFSTKYWLEILPNLKEKNDWQYNTELSIIAALNSIFSMKLGASIRYDHQPSPGIQYKTESLLTSSLLAKF